MTNILRGGFELVSLSSLCNTVAALETQLVNGKCLRVLCASLSAVASRAAHKRSTKKQSSARFTIEELAELTGLSTRIIKKSLKELRAAQLLSWSAHEVVLERDFQLYSASQEALVGRGGNRLVPIPRRVLRFLARCKKASLIRVMLAYMVRGLRRSKKDGINNKGSVKCSWIAEFTGLSLRSVKAARLTLISLGWLSKDTGSTQRKLNRTGSYFEINLRWEAPREKEVSKEPLFAPPQPQKRTLFAPPIKKQRTSYGSTKTKTTQSLRQRQATNESGFCEEVSFRNIKTSDLKTVAGVLALYRSALKLKLFTHSERNLLNFVAAAVKAKRTWSKPIAMFVWTVKNNFQFITQQDEIRAEEILISIRRKKEKPSRIKTNRVIGYFQESNKKQKKVLDLVSGITQVMDSKFA